MALTKSNLIGMAAVAALAIAAASVLWWTDRSLVRPEGLAPEAPTAQRAVPSQSPASDTRSAQQSQTPASRASAAPQRDWHEAFQNSDDYLMTVRSAIEAAEQGDGAAAKQLAEFMFRCATVHRSIRAGETKAVYMMNLPFGANPGYSAHMNRVYDQCAPVATAPEYSDWDSRPGGRVKYWRDLALKNGNPSLKAEWIMAANYSSPNLTAQQRDELRTQARAYARDVIHSRDPEAWYKLGMATGMSSFSKDLSFGYALALAACDLGYDCTGDNEQNDWYACRWQGCDEKMVLADRMKLIRRSEWDEIEKYVPLDGGNFREGWRLPSFE
jgi:hypothetical protein